MKRAAPGRRDRIEAALSPDLRAALGELCQLLKVRDWQLTPLGPPFQAAAAVLFAAELVRDGMAPTAALEYAAAHLDLEPETLRSWARRWPADSRGATCTQGSVSTGVSLIRDAAEALSHDADAT